jgi:hypothetical protein
MIEGRRREEEDKDKERREEEEGPPLVKITSVDNNIVEKNYLRIY